MGPLYIGGKGGFGIFDQQGGTVRATVILAEEGGSGSYTLRAGSLTTVFVTAAARWYRTLGPSPDPVAI